ncbi:MAG TPA: hypothetical protein VLC28_02390 [Flavitalea sp.]|nr:hypothetical protein [Flavitalea sp.]
MKKIFPAAEILTITLFALIPLFTAFPYRINIFLSWEGAYRMANGDLPYRDFGMPVGYMYWVIPALFFKVFGAQLITLIKAQAFINIVAGLAFRSILISLKVPQPIRFAGILLFVLSYSFPNYWPWYNHSVIVYELLALACLFRYFTGTNSRFSYLFLVLSGVFTFISFFTKQDGGALGLLICLALLGYEAILEKKVIPLATYIIAVAATGLVLILPVSGYGLSYWFNHGQAPHSSRVSVSDILAAFLNGSTWIKFYLFLIILVLVPVFRNFKETWKHKENMLFTLLTLGILAEAAIFQVTSYVPEDNNIFFHSFAFVFIFSALTRYIPVTLNQLSYGLLITAGVLLWWSPSYWKYIQRFVLAPQGQEMTYMTHGGYRYGTVVNKNTFMIELDTTDIPLSEWRIPQYKSFQKIMVPGSTADGIDRLMNDSTIRNKPGIKVLNMSELTPLAAELPFELEKGPDYPLWFHKGVAVFDKETDMFVDRINSNYYDLVLYEYIPYLNNFYPYQVREALMKKYNRVDTFVAPRKPTMHAWVEVYKRR